MAQALSVSGISKNYRTRTGDWIAAIESVSFDVEDGQFVSIVGPSGCGKTTLLKIITGLVKPNGGKVELFGSFPRKVSQKVGVVFQTPLLMPWRNVLENVLLPIELLHQEKSRFLQKATDLIDMVGLSKFSKSFPHELSGGMQHRVAIARALIHDPSILLMDEPLASLDEITREQLEIDLLKILEAAKKTVLLVTHSISEAVMMSNKIVVLSFSPSVVKAQILINLEGKRGKETRASQKYVAYCQEVRRVLGL